MKGFIFVLVSLLPAVSPNPVPANVDSARKCKTINEEVYFYHYARDRPDTAIVLQTGQKLQSTINPKLPWKFFIHGYTTSPWVSSWFASGKAAYFQEGKYNIVFVDWSKPANQSYLLSVINAMSVGPFLGKFIIHLNENGVSYNDIHLLGHSLGAHMAGFAGKYVRDKAEIIGRITGLDPAGPFYETNPLLTNEMLSQASSIQEQWMVNQIKSLNPYIFQKNKFLVPPPLRLSKNDANFVDIIHTDALNYGMLAAIGHCDFFPNSGYSLQPGCEPNIDENCSHAKSVEYFVDSINMNNFVAKECTSYEQFKAGDCKNNTKALMGEHTDHSTRGIYYLKTIALPPYGKGDM